MRVANFLQKYEVNFEKLKQNGMVGLIYVLCNASINKM